MALDPNAPLRPSLDQPYDILGTITKADTFNDQQQKRKDAETERQRQARINEIVQQYPDDPDAAIAVLRRVDWQAAATLQEQISKQKKAIVDARKVELENETKEAEQLAQLLGDGSETSWNNARAYTAQHAPEAAQFFQQPYSPELAEQVKLFGLSAQQRIEAERKATESLAPEKWAAWFATAQDEEDWQDATNAARVLLGKNADQVLGIVGSSYSPESVEKARQLAMGPAKVEDLKAGAESREIQREGQEVTKRGQDIQAATAAANRAVTIRGQNLVDARAKASQTAGGEGGVKLGVGAIEKIAGVDQSLAMIDDIERILKEMPTMTRSIGPMDGRLAQVKIATGVGVDEKLAEFAALLTGLENATIKATTGAQMSEPEAKRIMGQLPRLTSPEAVFRARLSTTRRNLEMLKRRTIELSSGQVESSGGGGSAIAEGTIKTFPNGKKAVRRGGQWQEIQ